MPLKPSAEADALDESFLEIIGWDWERRLVVFPADHRLLGWTSCRIAGCGKLTSTRNRLCPTCTSTWQRSGVKDLEQFAATARRHRRYNGRTLCAVVGCELPRLSELCSAHKTQLRTLGLSLEAFLDDPRVEPKRRFGTCAVLSCTRDREGRGQFCTAHRNQLRLQRRREDFDEERWLRIAAPVAEDNTVGLLGLADSVVNELLRGLQGRTNSGLKSSFPVFRRLANELLAIEATSVRDLKPEGLSRWVRAMRNSFVDVLDRSELDPRIAWSSPRWAVDSLGHPGMLRFEVIAQDWLREATKHWVFEELPRRRGRGVVGSLQTHISQLGRVSASLTRHRADGGRNPRELSRRDMVELLNWLAHLEATGVITNHTRHRECADLAKILRRMRQMGLTRPGRPLEGLPDDFALESADIPAYRDDEDGRDLPPEVVAALISHLPALGAPEEEVRVAVELIIDTGRRPGEITSLPLNCLDRDGDDKPVLIWNNTKSNRYGRRLPITESTARIIVDQQERVRARFSSTAVDQLVLLPGRNRNPHGSQAISQQWLGGRHRAWIDSLPELTAPVTVLDDAGRTVTRHLPFDKKQIQPYCWRHTYAQRHADAGVAVDVLCDLMDHTSMTTTQGYYRVSEGRRRDAVDRVTSMQFDRHGNQIWRRAQSMLDSERARRGLAEVAVPYGLCTEPTNVAAGGGDCPVRFRCVGCDHFRTDVSYLPDLQAYLADLLRQRERLRAMTTADAWAIAEAAPSDEEVDRIRTLIRRVKADLDDLDSGARSEIEAAVTAVRRARHGAVGLGMPRVRPEPIDIRKETRP